MTSEGTNGALHDLRSFRELGVMTQLTNALANLGYEEPTPIQREAIPPLLEGRDLLGQAPTGTGKTAAFALPLLQRLPDLGVRRDPGALILVPTRELAVQVSEAIHRYGRDLGARVLPVYGGQPIARQLGALQRGTDVVVATPGRALDHLARKSLRLDGISILVLDEADEMLDMGFADEIEELLGTVPESRQTVLFSATIPARIASMMRSHLREPVQVRIGLEVAEPGEAPLVRQVAYFVQPAYKPAALGRILDVEGPEAALVFCRRRVEVDELAETLSGSGYRAEALHGGMNQQQRERVMSRLRSGVADLIVATDVAARGLDIGPLTHVVNYDMPSSPEAYVHRIGRVGRAGRGGVAITLMHPREHPMLKTIERAAKRRITIEKVPTVADLRARQLELLRATLRESILEDALEHYRVVVEDLSEEFDLMEIALAAVKLAREAQGGTEAEEEIPEARPFREQRGKGAGPRRKLSSAVPTTRLWIGLGRVAGLRPQDVVGAITGEARLSGRDLGSIEIGERSAFVEVPESAADEVIAALQNTTIKGRKVRVSRERQERKTRGGGA